MAPYDKLLEAFGNLSPAQQAKAIETGLDGRKDLAKDAISEISGGKWKSYLASRDSNSTPER